MVILIIEDNRYMINQVMLKRVVEFFNVLDPDSAFYMDVYPYSTLVKLLDSTSVLNYCRNRLFEFITQIIAKGDMQDYEEDVVDLLSRAIDDVTLCKTVLLHETVRFEQISVCCVDQISSKKDNVKMLWNLLLEANKVALSWENIYSYWNEFGFTNELLRYIEGYASNLEDKRIQNLDDDFIGEFICSEIDDAVFDRTVLRMKMKNFNLSISSLSQHRVQTLIHCHFFAFTVQMYKEIEKNRPCLCDSFITQNQCAFREVINDIPLTPQLIEILIMSINIENETKQEILNTHCSETMTSKIAEQLCSTRVNIGQDVFDAAWTALDGHKRVDLMFMYLPLLDGTRISSCFSDLGGIYTDLEIVDTRWNLSGQTIICS